MRCSAGQRTKTIFWMWITVALGITFISFQAYEYIHAYSELNLKLSSGIYGSTFFMLTGFHGFHVFDRHADAHLHHAAADEGPLHAAAPLRHSKVRRGIGTSSTWSGWACTSWCTGCRRSRAAAAARRLVVVSVRPADRSAGSSRATMPAG